MKFIFPQNYCFKNKLFGIIDYSTLILNIIWDFFIFLFINFLFSNINLKIFLFIFLCLPIFLFSIIGFNHENIFCVFKYIFKYFRHPKIYLYCKNKL